MGPHQAALWAGDSSSFAAQATTFQRAPDRATLSFPTAGRAGQRVGFLQHGSPRAGCGSSVPAPSGACGGPDLVRQRVELDPILEDKESGPQDRLPHWDWGL